jgi:4-amino-4-deoxy-L-arabinose transferase-like glycosyltransferase
VTPIFEIYDEGAHTGYVRHLRETGELPVYDRETPPEEQLYGQQASQPPLYYLLGAILSTPASLTDFDARWDLNPHARIGIPLTTHNKNWYLRDSEAGQFPWRGTTLAVQIVRALSIVLALGVLLLVYRLAHLVSNGNSLIADTSLALVAFNPTFAHLAAGVNNDWLVIALCTLVLVLMVRRVRSPEGESLRHTFILSLLVAAAMLSKLSGVLLVPLFCWFILWEWRQGRYDVRKAARHLALFAVVLAVLVGWWLVRNVLLYGDLTATVVHLWYWGPQPDSSLASILLNESYGIWLSFWGVFGAYSFALPELAFHFISLLGVISLLGLILGVASRKAPGSWRNPLWLPVLLWLALVVVGFLRWATFLSASQGRLLYPAIAPLALLMAIGLTNWKRWIPATLFQGGMYTALGGLAAISLATPWLILMPGYEPPPHEVVSEEIAVPNAVFGDVIALSNFRLDPTCSEAPLNVDAGESIPVQAGEELCVTLELTALREVEQNYSFSIQVIAPIQIEPLAQLDTYPGGGSLPTEVWPEGMQVVDSYRLPLDYATAFPTEAVLQLVMYDFETGERFAITESTSEPDADGTALPLATLLLAPSVPQQAEIEPVQFGETIELTQVEVLLVDDEWRLRSQWRALQDVGQDWQLFAHRSESPSSPPLAAYDHLLGGDALPTHLWREGVVVIEETVLSDFPFPENLFIGIYDPVSGERLPAFQSGQRLEADAFNLPVPQEFQR